MTDSFCMLQIILVIIPANSTIFILTSGLGDELDRKRLTISSISFRDYATLI